MNDLMTKSFLSYVDLKKQAAKDLESSPDLEMGQLHPSDEKNLSSFFEEVNTVKNDIDEINNLLLDLHDLNHKLGTSQSSKILRGFRDRINSDVITVLRKARLIKTRLEMLDKSNITNRTLSAEFREGSPIDRTRMSVTHGLRVKLKEIMNEFQSLRDKILSEHKEGLKRQYYSATGENPNEEMIEKMTSEGGLVGIFNGKEDMIVENKERHEALKEIQKSLVELHQVFLDMAVMVETQGEQMNNIEQNVVNAGAYINGGTKELDRAKRLKKTKTWACWIGVVVLVFVLVCLIAIMF